MAQQNRTLGRIPNALWPKRLQQLARDTRGNTYFMVAAALLPMIGIVGSGVDIGRAYMADLRLQQACDAGVLAGRRVMSGTTYTTANQTQATKMFNFNFQPATYGSTNITFSSVQDGPSNVKGTATARLPTALMQVFGQTQFDLTVNCSAKLEISNVDVMLVLDVTGSMSTINSGDSITRLQALKNATMNFFDTLTSAAVGDGRIRFGVVPYNQNINVGDLIRTKNINWLASDVTLPSRTPKFVRTWGTGTTTYGTPFDGTISFAGNWSNSGGTINGKTSTTCPQTTPLADTAPTTVGNVSRVQTGQTTDANGNLVTTYTDNQDYQFYNYRYAWSSNRCRSQRQTATFTRATPVTVTQPPVPQFSHYIYEDQSFDVANARSGGTVTFNTGDEGQDTVASWNGCIIERETVPYASTANIPPAAFDMDIDMVPTTDEDTQWRLQMGHLAYPRSTNGPDTTTDDRGSWGNNSCPQAAMKLTAMTASNRGAFDTYIQALTANGTTYHSGGMTWGARLISPTGIFSDENTTAPNGRPIQRHILFMTDGDMFTRITDLSYQGHEQTMNRVGQHNDGDGNDRHTNRFLQLCASVKSKNVTVWTIDFDTPQTPSLVTCASGSDKAFMASNAAQLNTQFQAIARQIARLRIHE